MNRLPIEHDFDTIQVPLELRDVRKDLEQGQSPKTSPRVLLGWFNAFRRGPNVVSRVRRALRDVGLETVPDFEGAFIDDITMGFHLLDKSVKSDKKPVDSPKPERPEREKETDTVEPVVKKNVVEPTFKLRRLNAANHRPLTTTAETRIQAAVTHMLQNDYSQLPVMHKGGLAGLLSWRSISHRFTLGLSGELVRDFMDKDVVTLDEDDSIFKAANLIVAHECILVCKGDGSLGGIVTNADLGTQFGELGEPFLLIGEIETCLRNIMDDRFQLKDFREMVHFRDDRRRQNARSAADLTFGEYLFGIKKNWKRLKMEGMDRGTFLRPLYEVKRIRNEVMHFDPDGISDQDKDTLRKTVNFFQNLRNIGYLDF
ncbi:MAG: CBS domain-containing protein [Acidobacteriota bacterium]|nr:CBS domain-containing protein [Acidobacteriota bacterium]